MYFVSLSGKVYHILRDRRTASAVCGVSIPKLDLYLLSQDRTSPRITAQKPDGLPICKSCLKQAA